MAYKFRHNVTDGFVFIDNNTGVESIYPYAWWITQEPAYTLPASGPGGETGVYREYIKNSYHVIHGSNLQWNDTYPWVVGDGYIAKQALYDADYATYLATPATLSAAKNLRIADLAEAYFTTIGDGIDFDNGGGVKTYPTDGFRRMQYTNDDLVFTAAGAVPGGYYVNDITGAAISFTLTNIQDLDHLIQTNIYDNRVVYDTHYANIMALGTIAAVMAYDVSTGWV